MEGDISKHHSTESVASSASHIGFSSDFFFDLTHQMSDCLATSNQLLKSYPAHEAQIHQYKYIVY
jgi:hypothetical protein